MLMALGGLIAQYLNSNAWAKCKSILVSILGSSTIVFALIVDATLFNVQLTYNQIVGLTIVLFF